MIPPFKVSTALAGITNVSSSKAQVATTVAPGNSKFAQALASKQQPATTADATGTSSTDGSTTLTPDQEAYDAFKKSFVASCSTLTAGDLDTVD